MLRELALPRYFSIYCHKHHKHSSHTNIHGLRYITVTYCRIKNYVWKQSSKRTQSVQRQLLVHCTTWYPQNVLLVIYLTIIIKELALGTLKFVQRHPNHYL